MRTPSEGGRAEPRAAGSRWRLGALREPRSLASLGEPELDLVLRGYRAMGLLPALAFAAESARASGAYPPKVREHLLAARLEGEAHARSIRWEANRVRRALRDVRVELVALKGAAYVLADLPPGRGRLVQDFDVMVPKERLPEVERALLGAGWEWASQDPYDQRYYRSWMHELPPLRHRERGTWLDVHHTILPASGRLRPDARKLLEQARPTEEPGFRVLAPLDMVLHTAAHMLGDENLGGALRDLTDLDALVRHFSATEPRFLDDLVPRARELGLARPLFYALRSRALVLGSPVPPALEDALIRAGRPPGPVTRVMDALLDRCFVPRGSEEDSASAAAARWLLYVRAHWLRMPARLLIPHLARKAARNLRREESEPAR